MVTRTAVFRINLTDKQKESFGQTVTLYTKAWSDCVDVAWDMQNLSKKDLHKATYYILKAKYGLKSQYLCSSRNRAFESVMSARKLANQGKKVSKPSTNLTPIRLDARTLSFNRKRTVASIATQGKREKVILNWHPQAGKFKDWSCSAGEIGIDKNKNWVLRLIFTKEVELPPRTNKIVGADRGIKHPIVLSDNRFYGEAWWKEHERKLRLHIARLQSKGTKSAKKRLKKVWRRLKRFKEDCDRVIAKQIIAALQPGDTIALEDLTNIRDNRGAKGKAHKKHRRKMGRWSFNRLESTLTYNAELNGVYVEHVEAHYTSQTCSKCNMICKKNRRSQSTYSCQCGLTLNADLNAARNIAKKWCLASGEVSGLPVDQPIVADALSSVLVTSP